LRGAKYTRDKEEFGEKTFPSFRPRERERGDSSRKKKIHWRYQKHCGFK
jgi:hypothetical protein